MKKWCSQTMNDTRQMNSAATGRGAGGPASKTVVVAYGFWLFLLNAA